MVYLRNFLLREMSSSVLGHLVSVRVSVRTERRLRRPAGLLTMTRRGRLCNFKYSSSPCNLFGDGPLLVRRWSGVMPSRVNVDNMLLWLAGANVASWCTVLWVLRLAAPRATASWGSGMLEHRLCTVTACSSA